MRIGKQLCESIGGLTSLTSLFMDFAGGSTGLTAWRLLAQGPVFPALRKLALQRCKMDAQDFTKFVLKHSHILKSLFLTVIQLEGGSASDLKVFFDQLRASPKLAELTLYAISVSEGWVEFPTVHMPLSWDLDGEEDYVWVDTESCVKLEGLEEVNNGLGHMMECMTFD